MFKKLTSKTIEFYPTTEQAKMFPPVPAKMTLPEWYKELDSYVEGYNLNAITMNELQFPSTIFTVKRCLPVQDYIMKGYTLFTNTDILLSPVVKDGDFQDFFWSVPSVDNVVVSSHGHVQCPVKFLNKRHNYVKFRLNWRIKTPIGYSCLFSQQFYNLENRFTLLPAIVDTDAHDVSVGLIGFLNNPNEHLKLDAGTPLVNIFPFKREDWNMSVSDKIHPDKETKFGSYDKQFFINIYRNFFHSKKRFD